MLVYVDESGTPHPRDASEWSVLAAVCIDESNEHRQLSRAIHSIKFQLLGREHVVETELSANDHLRRPVFEKPTKYTKIVERVFDTLKSLDLFIFAVIIRRPSQIIVSDPWYLPPQYRFLLQRIDALMDQSHVRGRTHPGKAILLFDDRNAKEREKLAAMISRFLFLSTDGQQFQRISDVPYFVDSKVTPGIQVADLVAGCIRHCLIEGLCDTTNGNLLSAAPQPGDVFHSALVRFYYSLRSKMMDVREVNPPNRRHYALYVMGENEWMKTTSLTPIPGG